MDINRRKFLTGSLLLGGTGVFATHALSRTSTSTNKATVEYNLAENATYKDTMHNRQYYQNSRF